eukprot:4577699-Alexandrium_andersonii.AAC.1
MSGPRVLAEVRLYVAGAVEEATIRLTTEVWLHVTRPSGKRAARGWQHARALRLRVSGVVAA